MLVGGCGLLPGNREPVHFWVSTAVVPVKVTWFVLCHGVRKVCCWTEHLLGAVGGPVGGFGGGRSGVVHLPCQEGGNPRRGRGGVVQIGLCGKGVASEVGGADDGKLWVGGGAGGANAATETEGLDVDALDLEYNSKHTC